MSKRIILVESTSKYRCCYGCMHVKTGAILFCTLLMLNYWFFTDKLIDALYPFIKGDYNFMFVTKAAVGSVIFMGPLLGIIKTNRKCFVPCLIVTGLEIFLWSILLILSIIGCFPQTSLGKLIHDQFKKYCQYDPDEIEMFFLFLKLITFITVILIFQIWAFRVVFSCYKYISKKSKSSSFKLSGALTI